MALLLRGVDFLLCLVVMFVNLFNAYKVNRVIGANDIDGPISAVKSNGPLTLALTPKRLVMVAFDLPNSFQSCRFNQKNPKFKLINNIFPNARKIRFCVFTNMNDSNHSTHSDASDIPLGAEARPEIFKLLLLDVGLLNALLGLPWNAFSSNESVISVRNGAIAEQFVGQEVIATIGRGRQQLNYWLRDGKSTNAEIDYVVMIAGSIVPIEVKAGKTGTLRSLRSFCELKQPQIAIRFDANLPSIQTIAFELAARNTSKDGLTYNLISLPIYASGQIARVVEEMYLL